MTRLWRRRALAILAPLVGLACVTWAQTFFSAAAIVAVPACSNSDAGGVTPITGVLVLGDTLTAGHGCGTGDDQVYAYATIISIPTSVPGVSLPASLAGTYVTGGTNTCFTNATFVYVCTYYGGDSAYDLSIYAFNEKEWNATLEPDGGSSVTEKLNLANGRNLPSTTSTSSSCAAHELASITQAAVSPGAGWTTTCTAAEQLGAPVTAACAPLQTVQDASP